MSKPLQVTTGYQQSHSVIIDREWPGENQLPEAEKMLVVIDGNVAELYGEDLRYQFGKNTEELLWYEVPPGEGAKSFTEFNNIIDYALSHRFRRKTPVVAVGGGVTGDLAGYVAASLLRGVPLYHFPTTLLAMVDSAIGGKTGINHSRGKNLVGAFYQPEMVWANVTTLQTLPELEWRSGMSEVLKYACIARCDLLERARALLNSNEPVRHEDLAPLVEDSAAIKVDIVCEDEREAGKRAFLNFGHTFAHAIETFTRYERFTHGEAVYIGIVAALWLSRQLGAPVDPEPLLKFRSPYGLSTLDLCSSVKDLVSLMESDKKNLTREIRVVTLSDWEQPELREITDRNLLESAFEFAFEKIHDRRAAARLQ